MGIERKKKTGRRGEEITRWIRDDKGQSCAVRWGGCTFSPGENTALGNVSFLRVFLPFTWRKLREPASRAPPPHPRLGPLFVFNGGPIPAYPAGTARHLKREDCPKEARAFYARCARASRACTNEIERNALNVKYPCRFSPIPTLSSPVSSVFRRFPPSLRIEWV